VIRVEGRGGGADKRGGVEVEGIKGQVGGRGRREGGKK